MLHFHLLYIYVQPTIPTNADAIRTRKTSSNTTSFSLAQKMLPRELLQQLRMESQPKLRGQKRKHLATVQEEEEG